LKSRELSQNKTRTSARVNDISELKIPRDKKTKTDNENVFLKI